MNQFLHWFFSPVIPLARKILQVERRRNKRVFAYDEKCFWLSSGKRSDSLDALEARIIMHYHVLEKGLTMPNRRLGFGMTIIASLIDLIEEFEHKYGMNSRQVAYAVGVVKEYEDLHRSSGYDCTQNSAFWMKLHAFTGKYTKIPNSKQRHYTRSQFYAAVNEPFGILSASRHCVRNYSAKEVSRRKIKDAVAIALDSPSACNRNHARVHCVTDKSLVRTILDLQGGTRGFGHLADKVLIVTTKTEYLISEWERKDDMVNGGMFLMSLCLALYCQEVAYCILTWAVDHGKDRRLRNLINLPDAENVVALLCVGEAPDEFDVAASPRRSVDEVLAWHGGER